MCRSGPSRYLPGAALSDTHDPIPNGPDPPDRAAEALRRSEQRYRALVEASNQVVWSWSPAESVGDFDRTQEWWGELTGQPVEEQRASHTAWLAVVHPDDREAAGAAWATALATGGPYDVEYRVRARAGGWRHVKARGVPIPGPGGSVGEWVGTLDDVTDRRTVEAARREGEERFRGLMEQAPFSVQVFAPDGRTLGVNRAWEDLWGLTPDQVADYNLLTDPQLEAAGVAPYLRRAAAGEVVAIPAVWYDPEQTIPGRTRHAEPGRWVSAVAYPLTDSAGLVREVVLVHEDVTARTRAEAERARLTETLSLALAAADLGTWDWDPATDRTTLSDRAAAIYGLPPGRPYGREWMRGLIRPDHRVRAREAAERAVRERAEYDQEYPLERGGWVAARGRGLYDAAGGLTRMLGVVQDVTGRKAAEAESRRSEERYRVLVNASADVVYRMSPDWEVMHPLDGRGLVPSSAEPIRGWMQKNLPASEHARVREAIARAVADKGTFELEHRVNRDDGTLGWTFSRAVPILDAGREIAEWFGTARDVTDRKRAEEALRRREEEMSDFFENAAVGLHWVGPDGTILRAIRAELDLLGYSPGEYVGRNIAEFHADREVIDAILGRLGSGETLRNCEARMVCGDGSLRHVLIDSSVLWEDGRFVHTRCFTRDVTDRVRAEAGLREREERLQMFLGNATDYALIISDADDRALEWLGGSEAITGWRADEAAGRPLDFIFTPEDRAAGVPRAETRRAAETGRAENARWHERKDGTRFFAEGVTVGIRGPGGELRGFGKVFRDATARKRAEDAIKEADRKKDDFIALLAHELRNPLAPIRNGLQVIRLSEDRAVRDRSQKIMGRQLAHMVRLIDDLLDVSRIGRNKMELRRANVSLADVVGSAVETARPAIEEAGHELTVSLPPDTVFLDADLTRLAQVFSNLLTNSAKYTERGGKVWLTAEGRDGTVRVTVRDTGIGIPADALPTVFDMFSQVDRPTERSAGGLGIGLALVKGLVEMHGGTVTARSDGQGRGSEFAVTLPALAADPAGGTTEAGDAPDRAVSRRRVLVVDDNRDGAESLAVMLGLLGDEVTLAHDGLEAVERAQAFRPGVILMDVGMPRLDGLEATRRIRSEPWGRGMTIVALTGWGQAADRERSRAAGCDGHLVKPVNLPDLEGLLAVLRSTGCEGSRVHAPAGKGRASS